MVCQPRKYSEDQNVTFERWFVLFTSWQGSRRLHSEQSMPPRTGASLEIELLLLSKNTVVRFRKTYKGITLFDS